MRIPALAVVAISAVLLTGCSGGDDPATPAAQGAAPAAADGASQQTEKPTDTALSEDTEAICAQASRTSNEFGKTFAEDYQLLIKAAAESKEAKARAQEKVSRDLENFSFALLDMSKLAADPTVKKALSAMGAQVTALKGDVSKVDEKKLAGLHSVLDKACGRG
jgi:PBP1b-binding outer membrane lipoprotein LpoB